MKIAITGVGGNLGSVLEKKISGGPFTVWPIPAELYRPQIQAEDLTKLLRSNDIEVLIHCASLTNVEFSETDERAAYLSNVVLTDNLAKIAESSGIKMVFISSTGVYGNNTYSVTGLNREIDEVLPLNIYHKTKFQAELAVEELCTDPLILRVGWLFGSEASAGKDFVLARVQEMARLTESAEYSSNIDQFGNPTSSEFISEKIIDLLRGNAKGVINCVNEGAVSRYDFVRRIKEECGFEFKLVPRANNFFSRTATVPLNETGDTSLMAEYSQPMPWDDYLIRYCDKLRNNAWRNQ